ncbi:MAG TPA: hypothetical protein VN026_16565 [Bacteroidia bacterium]|jgi:hypothetical protein|nr:hypothetical protein [Bacteroidia bacterium]
MEELPDLNTGISKPDLFEKFKIQLRKDFENCGLDPEFTINLIPDYDLIFSVVNLEIEKINKSRSNKLNELLYRIDISEQQIKKAFAANSNSTLNEIISELIIKRELQKIVIKEHYGNPSLRDKSKD